MKFQNSILFFLLGCILFFSCESESYIYRQSQKINPKGWLYPDSLNFEFDVQDTALVYSLLMDIEHTPEYRYQNLYMNISTTFPSGKNFKKILSSDLAEKSGKWHGKCSPQQCSVPIHLQEKTKFNEVGKHTISISQFSRDSALMEMNGITIKLKKYQKSKNR